MNYFQLFTNMRITPRWYLAEVVLSDGTEPPLRDGQRLALPGPLSTRTHHPGPPLTFCQTTFNVPVATDAIARAVQAVAGDEVQCLPLTIPGHPGYQVLNATRTLKVVNEERSEFVKWTTRDHRADLAGSYRSVTRLVLKEGSIPSDAHFFRVKGWEVVLVVSERVKAEMEDVGCRGAEFMPLPMA